MSLSTLLLLLASPPAPAQDLQAGRRWLAEDFELTVFDVQRGLPQRSARSFAQTHDGIVWIGTFNGLARLSSRGVEVLPDPVPGAHTDSAFISLLVDRAGRLWAGTAGDILCLEDGAWRAFGAEQGWPGGCVYWLEQDAEGRVLASGDKGVFASDGTRFEPVVLPDEFVGEPHPRLTLDDSGALWLQSADTLAFRSEGRWSIVAHTPGKHQELGLARARAGGVWALEGLELVRRDTSGRCERHSLPAGVASEDSVLCEDPSGNLWVGLFQSSLLRRSQDGVWSRAREPEGLPNCYVPALFLDQTGALWIGTAGGGAARLSSPRFRREHDASPYVDENVITDLIEDGDGGLFFGTHAGGLIHLSDGRERTLFISWGKKEAIQSLARGARGDLWIGTEWSGLWRRHGESMTRVLAVPPDFGPIRRLALDPEENLWIGGIDRLGLLSERELRTHALPGATLNDFALGPDGALWLATSRGAYRCTLATAPEPRPEVTGDSSAFSLLADANGLWFTTDGPRLVRLDDAGLHAFGPEQGFRCERAALLCADAGGLWIASDGELIRWPRSGDPADVLRFGREDGLALGLSQPRGMIDRRGAAWLTTTHGLIRFDPRAITRQESGPPARIHSLSAGRHALLSRGGPVELPPGERALVVHLEAPLGPNQAEPRWQHRQLAGGEWLECRDILTFPDLAAGSVSFEARVAYGSGPFGPAVRLDLLVPPRAWERTWVRFTALAAGLALLAFTGLRVHRARLRAGARRAADELRAAEERARAAETLRLVTGALPASLVFVTPAGRIRWCNPQFEASILGTHATSGERLFERDVREAVRSILVPRLARALAGETVRESSDLPDGTHLDLCFVPQRNGAGLVIGAIGLLIDTTERHELETRLSRAQRLEALGTFASGIAHDFNNLLAVIMGRTELALLELENAAAARDHLSDVMLSSRRARDLVARILAFGRRGPVPATPCDVSAAAAEALLRMQSTLPAGVVLRTRLAPESRAQIDTTRVQQIVANLVSNGVLALEGRAGTLTVSVERGTEDQVLLSVADDGCGMSAEVQARVFDPFFTTRPVGAGTGLGLAVVHGIVSECGGSIEVDSHPGSGTIFLLRFPAAQIAQAECELVPARPGGVLEVPLR
jgi:signal transduction histidine kinase/ligand-binding sensor domain-containing protein